MPCWLRWRQQWRAAVVVEEVECRQKEILKSMLMFRQTVTWFQMIGSGWWRSPIPKAVWETPSGKGNISGATSAVAHDWWTNNELLCMSPPSPQRRSTFAETIDNNNLPRNPYLDVEFLGIWVKIPIISLHRLTSSILSAAEERWTSAVPPMIRRWRMIRFNYEINNLPFKFAFIPLTENN